eukprot:scaffold16827_cov74-Skeletonema_menzelii.AAC.5
MTPSSTNNNYHLQRLLFTALIITLHPPSVWTWTTNNRDYASTTTSSIPSSRVATTKQRIVSIDELLVVSSRRRDGLTILQEGNIDDHDGGISLQLHRRWNRLRWRRRRDDVTQLFASNSDNDDDDVVVNDDDNEVISDDDAPPPEQQQQQQPANEVNEFVQKAQQAWTSPPPPLSSSSIPLPKINMNKLNKTGARESLLNSVSKGGTTSSSSSSIGKGQEDSIPVDNNTMGIPPPPLKGASSTTISSSSTNNGGIPSSSSPFTSGIPSKGMSKKMMTTKSYGGKWGSFGKGKASSSSTSSSSPTMKSFSDGIGGTGIPQKSTGVVDNSSINKSNDVNSERIDGGNIPPPPIMKGTISNNGPIQSPQQQQQQQQPPPSVKAVKSPSLFLKEFAKNNAPKFMPKGKGNGVDPNSKDSSSTTITTSSSSSSSSLDTNNNNDSNNNNNNNNTNDNEEAKYLTVAKEAWSKFFSNQLSQEDYMTMALDAWRDNASSLVKSKQGDGGRVVVQQSSSSLDVPPPPDGRNENGNDDESSSTEKKEGAIDAPQGTSFFSGLKQSLFPGSNKSSGSATPGLMKGGESSATIEVKEEEENVLYGLRAKSPSSSTAAPIEKLSSSPSAATPIEKSPVVKTEGKGDSLKNYINSIKKSRSFGEKQTTPPPTTKVGDVAPMKSLGEKKQITLPPLPQMKKSVAPLKQLDSTVKKDWQGNRGDLSFLKSDKLSKEYKADTNYNLMKKAVTVEKITGVMKGKETSISGGNKLSSTSPPLDKGVIKLGIQGKFAPKKLDTAAKKDWQGNRGGLSFLKSDKLSKGYKADKNYNPMNKAVTVEKIKMLKISQASKAKSDDDTEESEDDEQKLEDTALGSTPELFSATSNEKPVEEASASRIERWNKESFQPTLKGSESESVADMNVNEEPGLPEGKIATTISITDQGGTDVVNPGRAFIPAPKATEKKAGFGGAKFAIKFASTKFGLKGGIPSKGGAGSPLSGSAKLLAKKSGLLKGSTGAKQFGSTSVGGFLNKQNTKKIDFSLLKKGGISSKLPFQKSGDVASNVKSAPTIMGSKGINGLSANDTSKSSLPVATGVANPPLSFKKASTPKLSTIPKTAEEAQQVNERRLNLEAKEAATKMDNDSEEKSSDLHSSVTQLIYDGVTAEEAERIRTSRLQTDVKPEEKAEDAPTQITEGMTAEEAELARKARIDISDSAKQTIKGEGDNAGLEKGLPLPYFAKKSFGGD